MKQVRCGVFETNSSSSHSLVIKKESEYVDSNELNRSLWTYKDGKIHFSICDQLEFGRYPFQMLATPYDKLRYLCASYAGDEAAMENIANTVMELVDGCSGIKFPKSTWGFDDAIFCGGIDHQSLGLLNGFLERNNISFKEFLTNKKYVMIVDGDEYNEWGKLKQSGLIDMDKIEREIP